MAFVLVYIGIGCIYSYGMTRWDWKAYKRWDDPSFIEGEWWMVPVGAVGWIFFMLDKDMREMCFEGLGED